MKTDKRVKISREDWDSLGLTRTAQKSLSSLCEYTLLKKTTEEKKPIVCTERIKLSFFILLYIPEVIRSFCLACWDYGLKNFEFPSRYLYMTRVEPWYEDFEKFEKYFTEKG